jgi:ABC-type lipoprotein export system ATPase subunit
VYDLTNVTVGFRDRKVLDAVSVSLGPGPVAVMGPSGSGKTTLIRVLAGQLPTDRGTVRLDGKLLRASARRTTARVSVIHQDYRLVEFLSVLDNVLLASEVRGMARSEAEARDLLARVGLGPAEARRKPGTLSGGEQQRVAIARALLCGATVLLADEPTGALDTATTRQITDLLLDLADAEQVRVVVATHDIAVARRMDDHLLLSDGRLRPVSLDDLERTALGRDGRSPADTG